MVTARKGMGRGLDALFKNIPEVRQGIETVSSSAKEVPMRLPIAALTPGQGQPRRRFDEDSLEELAESIRSQGIIQPILVRPCRMETATIYEIVAGERRWRAAQRAGLSEVPVYIREMGDEDALVVSLIENLQREDLNPLEEALAIQNLREKLGTSQEELSRRIGKSRSAVANSLRLLQLPEHMRNALDGKCFTAGHARAILAISSEETREELFSAIMNKNLSVRETENAVVHYRERGILPASITRDDVKKRKRVQRSETIKRMVLQLRANVAPRASISGSEQSGKITIPYESAEELETLLENLGVRDERKKR